MSNFAKKAKDAKKRVAIAEKELRKAEKMQKISVSKTTKAVEAAMAKVNKFQKRYTFLTAVAEKVLDNTLGKPVSKKLLTRKNNGISSVQHLATSLFPPSEATASVLPSLTSSKDVSTSSLFH